MLFLFAIALIVVASFGFTALSGAPWVPLRRKDIDALIKDLNLEREKVFIELGCGDGRLLKAAAMSRATVIGYELNPLLWMLARARLISRPNVKVKFGDFWSKPLNGADVVMTFLVPRTMPRLEKKLAKEMKPGSIFISYIFELPAKKPVKSGSGWHIYRY